MKTPVIHCPSCNNSMVTSPVSTFCPSCKYTVQDKAETPLDNLLTAIDEISFQYQPLRVKDWPALAVIEERYLSALETALSEYRKETSRVASI